jgi:transposase
VRRSYKFRLRPTRKQEAALTACLEDTRQLYNAALEERREAWRMGRHKVTSYSQDAQLKEIRADDPERYGRWAFSCGRAAIRRLDRAFQGFFRRVRAGGKPGYPRFKGRGWWDSIEWPAEKGGARWDSVPHPKVTRVFLTGIGHVRVHQHRALKGHVKTITAKLKITNMTRRPKPRRDGNGAYEPNGAAAKAGLNKSIHDAGWGIFLRVLSAKAESAGRTVIAVNPRHTSQRCAECGHVEAGNRVTQETFRCLACGHQAHADVNAARNILRAGLALQEALKAT